MAEDSVRKNSRTDSVLESFSSGFSCSQAMLSEYGPEFGLDRESALRVSGAFGGGMGKSGNICGAVTGGLMIIGLRFASIDARDKETRKKTDAMAREFMAAFESKHGALLCRDLLGCDIGSPEAERQKRRIKNTCKGFVRGAAELIDRILKK